MVCIIEKISTYLVEHGLSIIFLPGQPKIPYPKANPNPDLNPNPCIEDVKIP